MNKFLKILSPLAVVVIIAGCAQETTSSTGEQAREYLELVMSTEYPSIQPDQWGMYLLKETPGTGAEWSKDATYSMLRSTIRSLDGTILSSTEADIAKQLDETTYKSYNYYGPRYQNTSEGTGYAGLEYLLTGMKVGGSRMAVIPSWLLTTSRFGTEKEYLDACTSSTHLIYDITLDGQCEDVLEQEIKDLRTYVTEHFGESEKSYIYKDGQKEGTFYFVSDSTSFKADDKRAEDATLYLTYTGRRLDGQAFDTNDQAVALKEGLFQEGRTYSKSTIKFSATYSSITMGSSSSLIDGFKQGLYKMHWAGQKATVLFVSDLGYSSSGSGDLIPPYAPLIFELELSE
ncbi:MAG: FKBP-type peptidyl-prolyl cis-trans isomerase [Bacteroidales bacterium]|nr:FKBP-type peptidyl-prolyl cis-trans isomerase [Bacteroidales bacterium]